MKKKRYLSLMLAMAMTASTAMTVYGSTDENSSAEISHDELLTIEVYSAAANFQGIQGGWFGKEIKDRFNIELNIIAPNISGDAASLYQTRCASGDLGDIIILDNADMSDCVDAGLVANISDSIYNWENLTKYQEQIDLFNGSMESAGEGEIYAIPGLMNSISSTAYLEETVYISPRIPWDYYTELGSPELSNLDDFLQMLVDMQEAHPTNENGDKAYAFSLWSDWDGDSLSNVIEPMKWYGQEANGSVLIGNDNTIVPLTDKTQGYYKTLHMLYQANQLGLVDPDSATQDWSMACEKMQQKRVYVFWYNWQRGFWNTPERGETGDYYMTVPIADMNVYNTAANYYGDGRAWGIGSQVNEEDQARILEFMDWLCSPEGLMLTHVGQEGVIYTVNEDGTYTLTEDGTNRFTQDIQMPEELGGGLWVDGQNQINHQMVAGVETNPLNGEAYTPDMWSSTVEANQTKTTIEWSEKYGAANEVEYFLNNDMMRPVASINISLTPDTTDIALIRSQCADVVCDSSWRMIYAKDDAEFDQMWEDMCTQLEGLGWDELVAFDTEKYQAVIDARIAALE